VTVATYCHSVASGDSASPEGCEYEDSIIILICECRFRTSMHQFSWRTRLKSVK
jgi:hypothetical protein